MTPELELDYEAITKRRWPDARIPRTCSSCFARPYFQVLSHHAYLRGETTGSGTTRIAAWKDAAFAAMAANIRETALKAAEDRIERIKKEWFDNANEEVPASG